MEVIPGDRPSIPGDRPSIPGDRPRTALHQVTFVVIDVETTGGSPAVESLTEVAGARYRAGELTGTLQTLVRPDSAIPPFIAGLTGITDAMVADAPAIEEVLPSFLEFVGTSVLVGHNLRFDLSFLDHALVRDGREPLANPTVDTLALARKLVKGTVTNCKLATLAHELHLDHQPRHRAMSDVLATGDLLHLLLERVGSYGIVDLEELLDLRRLLGHPHAARLPTTNRLPHRPGIYWLTDAVGHVLYVGDADDLRDQVRSLFTATGKGRPGKLTSQLHGVHHRECPDPVVRETETARLVDEWSPPFNARPSRSAKRTRPARTGLATRRPGTAGSAESAESADSAARSAAVSVAGCGAR